MAKVVQIQRPYTRKPPTGVRPNLAALPSGLISSIHMLEGGGSTVRNDLGAPDGTLSSSTTWAVTKEGVAVDIGGAASGDDITAGYWLEHGLSATGSFSIEIFAHVDSVSTRGGFLQCGHNIGSLGRYLYIEGDTSIRFSVYDWTANLSSITCPAPPAWHHIVATYNADTDKLNVFRNGVKGVEGTNASPADPSSYQVYLGDVFVGYNRELDGQILYSRFYNRALNAGEAHWLDQHKWAPFSSLLPIFIPAAAPGGGWSGKFNEVDSPLSINESTIEKVNEVA